MDLSNKSLALLLVSAIVLSFAGTLISLDKLNNGLTGLATGTGKVNLSVEGSAACTVVTNVSFGGSIAPSSESYLTTDTQNFGTFQNCTDTATVDNCKGLTLNNTGNTNVTVTYNSSVNATGFLIAQTGLSDNDFQWTFRNGTYDESNAGCLVPGNTSGNVTNTVLYNICNRLTNNAYLTGATAITMEFNITLEPDISQGQKNAIITFECTDTGD